MNNGKLSAAVEPLRELLYQQETVLAELKKSTGKLIAGLVCDMLPVEVLASFDLIPVRLLPMGTNKLLNCSGIITDLELDIGLFDWIIIADRCCKKINFKNGATNLLRFKNFSKYGEEASIELHGFLDKLLKDIGLPGVEHIDNGKLASAVQEYDTLRRLIRGICSVRLHKPDLLTNEDMFTILTAGQCLPPEVITRQCVSILDLLNRTETTYDKTHISSLVYGGMIERGIIFDKIEDAGLLVAEDDTCNGRRQFDISLNYESKYLYYEILDAFSYRPLCPSMRSVDERFELLYKLLKNYNIELVVFLSNNDCKARNEQVDRLKKKLMRLGIDSLVITEKNVSSVVKKYVSSVKEMIQITNVPKR